MLEKQLDGVITGSLSNTLELSGKLQNELNLTGELTVPAYMETNIYDGSYEITPSSSEQKLDTAGKRLLDDVVVKEIPYAETSNLSGGYTAIIGG